MRRSVFIITDPRMKSTASVNQLETARCPRAMYQRILKGQIYGNSRKHM